MRKNPCSGAFAQTRRLILHIYCCSGILKLGYIIKPRKNCRCEYRHWTISSAKHLTLCSTTIPTQQTPLTQMKILNALGNKQQWRKPLDTEIMNSGIIFMPMQTNGHTCIYTGPHSQPTDNCKRRKKQLK